jgi:UDP-N-acetyl-2-amino-2-deoxyglucuronate dehydrogenase
LPEDQSSFRSITIDGEELEFSGGFTELHTLSYKEILKGNGFTLEDVRPSIETVSQIRTAKIETCRDDQHPFLSKAWDKARHQNGRPV